MLEAPSWNRNGKIANKFFEASSQKPKTCLDQKLTSHSSVEDFGVIEVVIGDRIGKKSHFSLLEARVFCFPCMIEFCLLSSAWQSVVIKMPIASSSTLLPAVFLKPKSQRGKLLKLFLLILRFPLCYFYFDKMHLFKQSSVCTLENVTPFCTEFLEAKKKNWLINKYNFLWFCSSNLGELLYCKPRKLTPSDKVWLYLAWSRFHSEKMYSFLRPLTESYSQTFSKVFRSYYLRLTMAWTKRFETLFIVSLWLWVSKFFLKWSVFEFWVLMSEG